VNRPNVIHSIIPDFSQFLDIDINKVFLSLAGIHWPKCCPGTVLEFKNLPNNIKKELKNFKIYDSIMQKLMFNDLFNDNNFISQFARLDIARDGHHCDYLTAGKFVDSIIERLKISSS
jgi:hypothetical protein